MRSLWRRLALRWLGGDGSAALTEDPAVRDAIFLDAAAAADSFGVRRAGAVHQAATSPGVDQQPETETASEEGVRSQPPQRDPR